MLTWRRALGAVLLAVGGTTGSWASTNLEITSFAEGTNLVFRTPDNYTSQHHYRVECSTSLVSAAWASVWTVGGVGTDASLTSGVTFTTGTTFCRVVATSNSATFVDGAYMVIDVSGGTNAANYPVTYCTTSAAVPGGITNDVYKTTHILMRRIPKGTFTMGSPEGELGRWSDETQHPVTLTKDFYIGVFAVTQKQWERVMGTWPSYFTNTTYRDSRPVEQVSYYDIRENPDNSAISPNWPQSSQVHADSFMGKLRSKTGLATLDLPTESQWEYACRAGTATALNSGKNLTDEVPCPHMSEVGRYVYNGGSGYSSGGDTSVGSAKVESYLPNAWGLYNMHGNVLEWCLDWSGTYPGTVSDPQGAASGSHRLTRGGSWSSSARSCRSAYRNLHYPSNRYYYDGFRLSRTLP